MKPFFGAFSSSPWPARALGLGAAVSISLVCRAGLSAAPIELPAECGTAADFERELRARSVEPGLLGQTQVSVERDSSGYRLLMRVRGESREFRDADCGALLRAAVVVVVALSEASQRSESLGGAAATKSQDEIVAPPGSADVERPRRARFFAGLGAGVNVGLLPRSSVLFELETGVSGPHWGLLADARVLPHSAMQDSSGHGVNVHAFGAQLAATFCPVDAWRFQVGGGAYRLSGSGLGSALPLSDSAWAIVLTSGASFIPVRRNGFELGFGIEGALHLQRPGFEIRGYGEVFHSSLMGGSFLFRLAQSFQ